MLGFGGVSCVGYHNVDWGLIIALIERWKRETQTFHFTFGEATIALQDVVLLWGLLIDGEPLIEGPCMHSREYWQRECFRLLGLQAPIDAFEGNRTRKVNLMTHVLVELLENPIDEIFYGEPGR